MTPLDHRVLVRRKRTEEKTKGGIILPDEMRNKQDMAEMEVEIVKLGETAFQALYVKPERGDIVYIARYAGSDQKNKDDVYEHRIVNDGDIVGIERDIDIEKTIEEGQAIDAKIEKERQKLLKKEQNNE